MRYFNTFEDGKSEKFSAVVDIDTGHAFKSYDYANEGRFILRTLNITKDGKISKNNAVYLPLNLCEKFQTHELKENDILMVMVGATIGKIGFITKDILPALLNQNMWRFRPKTIDPLFLFYLLKNIVSQKLKTQGSARDFFHIGDFRNMELNLPNMNTQKKIAQKLNYILTQLDEKKKMIIQLKQKTDYNLLATSYKANFLKLACGGDLTIEWRKNHSKINDATLLLDLICERRQIEYAQKLKNAKMRNERKPKSKFLLEIPKNTTENQLPDTWTNTSVGFLSFVTKLAGFEYTKYFTPTNTGEIPLIKAQNVQMGHFERKNIKYISKKVSDYLPRSQINGNEILMVFIGAGTGNVCLAPSDQRWHLAPNVAKIEVDGINKEFLYYYLQSPLGISETLSRLQTTAQPSLSMETIRMINVNLPPLEEQEEIVRIIKQNFICLEKYKKQVEILTKKQENIMMNINNLSMSILKSVFQDKLSFTF